MSEISFEVIHQDAHTLARRIDAKANGKLISTPTRAVSITRSNETELQSLSELQDFSGLAEIYVPLSQNKIDLCLEDDDLQRTFTGEISRKLEKAVSKRLVPYLLLSVKDNRGNPLNGLPATEELEFLGHLLWHPFNAIVVPPIFGGLKSIDEHERIIQLLKDQIDTSNERPILALIPSLYRSITREAIQKYWEFGARMFALDLDGRTLGAQSTTMTLVHHALNKLKKDSGEDFIIGGLNVKESSGTGETARVHGLLSVAYGLDFFGGNHIRKMGWAGDKPKRKDIMDSIRFFQTLDYGYYNLNELARLKKQNKSIEVDTPPFHESSLESVKNYTESKAKEVSRIHNAIKTFIEVRKFSNLINEDVFFSYLGQKNRIQRDLPEISKVTKSTRTQRVLE